MGNSNRKIILRISERRYQLLKEACGDKWSVKELLHKLINMCVNSHLDDIREAREKAKEADGK